eukprot:CAMPEP_0183309796 /NCGR_PEP_ID=MMETSP0160_2-20130417/25549_1 /TAXON_ID=2839 ORGANISM="Odontella Sinensis, Strain Grunow 1884" /NCGR_SAMPLE_ID=MMETSP0160_2 /ASSEMBLY_ACC=CAM_ASM_000250 /LENGTH=462 /DNA_ID=CAMNT_0025473873 /DNA_START=71 /DNA_END=1459 /DNA_ORIENTATION=+
MASSVCNKITAGDWDAVRKALRSKSSKDTFKSHNFESSGYNAFHLACANPAAPHDVISKMVRIDKDNLFQTTQGDETKVTPLHLACETGSADTVKLLLKLSSNQNHDVVNYVVMGGEGNWDQPKVSSLEVTWLRLIDPQYENHQGDCNTAESAMENLKRMDEVKSTADLTGKLKDTWDKTLALLWAASTGSMDMPIIGGGWHAVHAIANINRDCLYKRWCPSLVLWFALKLYPEQAKWADRDGNLPLHLATMNDRFHRHLEFQTTDLDDESVEILRRTQAREVQMLSELYPTAAKTLNKEGRLPLHLLAEFGGVTESVDVFDALLDAAPKAIRVRDPKTGLFPYMVKAVGRGPYTPYDMSGVYILLQSDPSILAYGTDSWDEAEVPEAMGDETEEEKKDAGRELSEEEAFLKRKHDEWIATERMVAGKSEEGMLAVLKEKMASDIKQYLAQIMKLETQLKKK